MKYQGQLPEKCDLCEEPLVDEFVDGVVQGRGWADMCVPCHARFGIGLGTGCGQKYHIKTGEKIAG